LGCILLPTASCLRSSNPRLVDQSRAQRSLGEIVHIGDDVTMTVVAIGGNQIRLGINAPKHVGVFMEKLYARIQHGATPERVLAKGRVHDVGA
jgi:carbon storage regulator